MVEKLVTHTRCAYSKRVREAKIFFRESWWGGLDAQDTLAEPFEEQKKKEKGTEAKLKNQPMMKQEAQIQKQC